jgi:hypothetical protein
MCTFALAGGMVPWFSPLSATKIHKPPLQPFLHKACAPNALN